MANDAHAGRQNRKVDRVRAREREMLRQEEGDPDGGKPFEGVHEENRVAPCLSQGAEDIRCSNVSAPKRTDINSRDAPSKISSGKGPK
jgi:hypothetical protein